MTDERSELISRVAELRKQFGRVLHYEENLDAWLALNLTIVQLKSLMIIRFSGSTNFKTLARILRVSPPNVTGVVDRLVEQGLVTREEDPGNRRMQILKVTEKGETLIHELLERGEMYFNNALRKMKTQDLESLAGGMAAMISAAREIQKNNIEDAVDDAVNGKIDRD